MSRFAVLADDFVFPSTPVLPVITPKSMITVFCPNALHILSNACLETRKFALALVCKFYGLNTDQYLVECILFDAEAFPFYAVISLDEFVRDMEYPTPTSKPSPVSRDAYRVFIECTNSSLETVLDRDLRASTEFKELLSEFWHDSRLETDDGEFNVDSYLMALNLLRCVFPELPFHYKANAFIDVIGPRVLCSHSGVYYQPIVGTDEYADSCELIHSGAIDMIVVDADHSDIVVADKYLSTSSFSSFYGY